MICDEVESALEAWGVGVLDRDERREVETHLAWCEACAEQAASLRRILGLLSTAPARADAAALEERILARAFGAPRPPRSRLPAAAAAGLLLGLLIPWGPPPPPPAPPAVAAAVAESPPSVEAPALAVPPPPAVEEDAPIPDLPPDVPSSAPATEAVAYSWEEATALSMPPEEVAFALWGVEPEPRETAVHAGPAFAGWSRDDELGGTALVGLCLKF